MRNLVVGLVLGLLAGGLGGRFLGRPEAVKPGVTTAGVPSAPACDCPPEAAPAPASTARPEVRAPAPRNGAGALPALDPEPPAGATTEVLRAENAHLREELLSLSRRFEEAQAELKETAGEPLPFPKGIDPRFGEPALRDAFAKAFAEVGAQGEISSIDCSEFPCIVYGEVDTREHREALDQAGAFGPYKADAHSVNAWSSTVRDKSGAPKEKHQFGIALYPRPEDKARRDEIGKRLKYRNEQVFEAMRPDDAE